MLQDDRYPTQHLKRSQYIHIRTNTGSKTRGSPMRILLQRPKTEWPQVWRNLHTVPINDVVRSTWYNDVDSPASIASSVLLWTYPLNAPDTLRLSVCKKLLTNGAGQGADLPFSCLLTFVTSSSRGCFSQYGNTTQTQTKRQLLDLRSYGLFCDQQ